MEANERSVADWWRATADLYEQAVMALTPDEFRAFMLERIGGLRMMAASISCIEESVVATAAYLQAGQGYVKNVMEARPQRKRRLLPMLPLDRLSKH